METHLFWNRFGISEGLAKFLISLFWNLASVAVGYVLYRLELANTLEATTVAVLLRSAVSGIFGYGKVGPPLPAYPTTGHTGTIA